MRKFEICKVPPAGASHYEDLASADLQSAPRSYPRSMRYLWCRWRPILKAYSWLQPSQSISQHELLDCQSTSISQATFSVFIGDLYSSKSYVVAPQETSRILKLISECHITNNSLVLVDCGPMGRLPANLKESDNYFNYCKNFKDDCGSKLPLLSIFPHVRR